MNSVSHITQLLMLNLNHGISVRIWAKHCQVDASQLTTVFPEFIVGHTLKLLNTAHRMQCPGLYLSIQCVETYNGLHFTERMTVKDFKD